MLVDRGRHLGWQKPEPHQEERAHLKASRLSSIELPPAAPTSSNSRLCCSLDQRNLGSCTANAWAQVCYMLMVLLGLPAFIASRLANYCWNRYRDGNCSSDTGATVGGAFEVGADFGLAEEAVWPYIVERFAHLPPPDVYRNAIDRKGAIRTHYFPVMGSTDAIIEMIERVLTSGRGVAFGRPVTEQFCSTLPSGIIQPPTSRDIIAGGHAETIVGHNRAEQYFVIMGSWGPDFHEPGQEPGCYRLAYETVALGGSDFWFAGLSTGGL